MTIDAVVITVSDGNDLRAPFEPSFGRAARFLVVDLGSGQVLRAVENPAAYSSHGAGIQAANLMGRIGVTAVISGSFGPKAVAGLRALGVSMHETSGVTSAAEALAHYRRGQPGG